MERGRRRRRKFVPRVKELICEYSPVICFLPFITQSLLNIHDWKQTYEKQERRDDLILDMFKPTRRCGVEPVAALHCYDHGSTSRPCGHHRGLTLRSRTTPAKSTLA
ncbi:unnamed protein product [Prunus armeniaca]